MANTSTLLSVLPLKRGTEAIHAVRTVIDTAGDHTVITPGGTIDNLAADTVTTGTSNNRWWVVGASMMDNTAKTMTIKSGTDTLHIIHIAAGGGIGMPFSIDTGWMGGNAPGEALVVNLSANAGPTHILWHIVLADRFGV